MAFVEEPRAPSFPRVVPDVDIPVIGKDGNPERNPDGTVKINRMSGSQFQRAYTRSIDMNRPELIPKNHRETVIMDPTLKPEANKWGGVSGRVASNSADNRRKNSAFINGRKNRFSFPRKDVTVFFGGAPSLKEAIDTPAMESLRNDDRVAFVTMSGSQNHVEGDYYIAAEGADCGPTRLKDASTNNTMAILCAKSHPDYRKMDWKGRRWYTHMDEGPPGAEMFWTYRTVAYDAVQFAARYLQSKHFVFVGFDGAASVANPRYHENDPGTINTERAFMTGGVNGQLCVTESVMYAIATGLEACAFMLWRKQKTCWNCGGAGVMVRNFIVCSLDDFYRYYKGH